MILFDGIVSQSLEHAARELVYIPGERPETLLGAAMRRGFARDSRVRVVAGTPKFRLPNWTRPPGGVDLVVDLEDGTGRLGMELKVGKPDESLWDAIKLADVQLFEPQLRAGYLVSDADWTDDGEGSGLFLELPARTRTCRDLISESPADWADTMIGGRGIRPCTSVGAIELTWIAEASLARHPGRRLVAVRVLPDRAAPRETYDAQGFPVGYEPPAELRTKIRLADEALACAPAGVSGPAPSMDRSTELPPPPTCAGAQLARARATRPLRPLLGLRPTARGRSPSRSTCKPTATRTVA